MDALMILERCLTGREDIERICDSIHMRQAVIERSASMQDGVQDAMTAQLDQMRAEMAALERALEDRRKKHVAELCASTWIVEMLDEPVRGIMAMRYCRGATLSQIADEAHYSMTSVNRYLAAGRERCRAITELDMIGFLPDWYGEMG